MIAKAIEDAEGEVMVMLSPHKAHCAAVGGLISFRSLRTGTLTIVGLLICEAANGGNLDNVAAECGSETDVQPRIVTGPLKNP
jgi:hypothetical protein